MWVSIIIVVQFCLTSEMSKGWVDQKFSCVSLHVSEFELEWGWDSDAAPGRFKTGRQLTPDTQKGWRKRKNSL